jgi:hypothetical protein
MFTLPSISQHTNGSTTQPTSPKKLNFLEILQIWQTKQALSPIQIDLIALSIEQNKKNQPLLRGLFDYLNALNPEQQQLLVSCMKNICLKAIPEMYCAMHGKDPLKIKSYHTLKHFCDVLESVSKVDIPKNCKAIVMALAFFHDIFQGANPMTDPSRNEQESLIKFNEFLKDELIRHPALNQGILTEGINAFGMQVLVQATTLLNMKKSVFSFILEAKSLLQKKNQPTAPINDNEFTVLLSAAILETADLHSATILYPNLRPKFIDKKFKLNTLFKSFSPTIKKLIHEFSDVLIGPALQSTQMFLELPFFLKDPTLRERAIKLRIDMESRVSENNKDNFVSTISDLSAALKQDNLGKKLCDHVISDLQGFWKGRSSHDVLDEMKKIISKSSQENIKEIKKQIRLIKDLEPRSEKLKEKLNLLSDEEKHEFEQFLFYLCANCGAQITQKSLKNARSMAKYRINRSFEQFFSLKNLDVRLTEEITVTI